MKRVFTVICVLMLSLPLCGFGKNAAQYIEPAQLTGQEQELMALLGANAGYRLFDFRVDKTVQSLRVSVYELKDGAWQRIGGGGTHMISGGEGRLALGFDKIANGLFVGISGYGSVRNSYPDAVEFPNMGCLTSSLSSREEVTPEAEIPLVTQVITSINEVMTFDFDTPERYVAQGYEHVYAITVAFSDKAPADWAR